MPQGPPFTMRMLADDPDSASPSSETHLSTGGSPEAHASKVVEHFFRHEAGRLHGALIRLLGPDHLSLAEDVAQEALLRAFKSWSIGGIPPNPSAWITKVAMNLARDALRHRRMSHSKEDSIVTHLEQTILKENVVAEPGEEQIRDDTLRLMFVCCHPSVALDAQVVLALKVICGFSTAEIARAFMSSDAAIEKQLTRTKRRIEEAKVGFCIPQGPELQGRLDGVLAALYLLFNEGYKASSGDRLLREDLCREAIRLTSLLVAHIAGSTPRSHALLALMCLNAARFPARTDAEGEMLRLDDQDRSKWDQALISRGLAELAASAGGKELSEYHLEAAIAACHCTAARFDETDWERIVSYYDQLLVLKPSPVVGLNRAVALAQLRGPEVALDEIEGIPQRQKLENHYLLHAVRGELNLKAGRHATAAEAFKRSLQLATVGPEQTHLARMIERTTHRPRTKP